MANPSAATKPAPKSFRSKAHLVFQDKKPGWLLGVRDVFEKLKILIASARRFQTLCKKEGSDTCVGC